ncbi:MAG: PQQ-dependent dehydrogenase, methanol/ethanol family [Spongiibacteraceae bacterium]|jgi:quinohemoprotein ethanol dehydrogenase|nr:PQQ-dependent dehydrogenase, methanol/ethanol family [Spongiibacteraceae bacterium]
MQDRCLRLPNWLLAAPLSIVLAVTAGCDSASQETAVTSAPEAAQAIPDFEWPMNQLTLEGQRYAPLDQINPGNVKELGLAWEFREFVVRGRTHRGMESNPIVVDGVMYMVGPWNVVYALHPVTGEELWRHAPEVDGAYARNACCDVVVRGLAIRGDTLYTATLDGYLVAIDRHTGDGLWRVDTFQDRRWSYSITGAPWVAGDKILVGNSGADMGARGYVSAYDADTGELVWRFWAVPGDPAAGPDETPEVTYARKTWPEDTLWELGLGGNAWDGMAYDPETNTAYLGLGNGTPHPQWLRSKSGAPGDHLFLASIVAVDADTGRMKWYYQTTPGDSWDYTATAPLVLADLELDGQLRQVIMQAPKNGFFYVLDRHTGELLRANNYVPVNWASGIDMETGRPILSEHGDFSKSPKIVWPSPAGGHAWHPMAYSPRTGLIYLPTTDAPMRYELTGHETFKPGTHMRVATLGQFPPFNNPGDEELLKGQPEVRVASALKAWDPIEQKAVWEFNDGPFLLGGTLVSGDLVFQGAADGYFRAFDARTGEVLHEIFVGTAIVAAPITYMINGVQYVAVTAGAGGPRGSRFAPDEVGFRYENFERLLVFRLGGGEVPLPAERQEKLPPLPEPIAATPEELATGEQHFRVFCQRCHVMGGAVGLYPDLWKMDPATIEAFDAIVHKGILAYGGMASFADVLSEADVQLIKAFIVNDTIAKRTEGEDTGAKSTTGYH